MSDLSAGAGPTPDPSSAPTVELLLRAAEQLIALRGIDGASDRAIMLLAGQRNKSVISYHFGGRQQLLDATWERGTVAVNAIRRERLAAVVAAGRADDLRELVRVWLLPQVEVLVQPTPTYWARFTARVLDDRPLEFLAYVTDDLTRFDRQVPLHTLMDLFGQMQAVLGTDRRAGERRVAVAARTFVALLAAWERDVEHGVTSTDAAPAFAEEMVEVVLAVLTAPPIRKLPYS